MQYDRAMLEALGTTGFDCHCPWYDGKVSFEGPLMRDVLKLAGSEGESATAIAVNDYSTEIPLADFTKYDVILAMKRDGKTLTLRDKGPLFIVYPYDSDHELQQEKYYMRSAWQVAELIIK